MYARLEDLTSKGNFQFQIILTLLGAEGLVICNPNSFYEKKRTWTMLKVKKFQDFEAKIISKKEYKLKRGNKKEFEMETKSGLKFKLRAGLTYMNFNARVGTLVTVKCQGFRTDGQPIRPCFMRTKRKV